MSDAPASPPPRIAVYGATGYTGRLIAAELDRRGAHIVLGGRNRTKLDALAAGLGVDVELCPVGIDDAEGLRAMLHPCDAVIACAGPFTKVGEPVLAAASEVGTHYLDTTGEQPFIRMAFDRYGEVAAANGSIVVSGMGFDYAPGDMMCDLVADGMGELEEIFLAYSVRGFRATRGTSASALEMMAGGDVEWRDGALHEASGSMSAGHFDFGEPIGTQPVVRYPCGEHLMVPRHAKLGRLTARLSASMFVPEPFDRVGPALTSALQAASRSPLRGGLERIVGMLPEGPSEEVRKRSRFRIVVEARAQGRRRRGTVDGRDVYGITAALTTQGAIAAATPGYTRSGALAPAEAFDAATFLDELGTSWLTYELEPAPDG